jgi:hypothetical protein
VAAGLKMLDSTEAGEFTDDGSLPDRPSSQAASRGCHFGAARGNPKEESPCPTTRNARLLPVPLSAAATGESNSNSTARQVRGPSGCRSPCVLSDCDSGPRKEQGRGEPDFNALNSEMNLASRIAHVRSIYSFGSFMTALRSVCSSWCV